MKKSFFILSLAAITLCAAADYAAAEPSDKGYTENYICELPNPVPEIQFFSATGISIWEKHFEGKNLNSYGYRRAAYDLSGGEVREAIPYIYEPAEESGNKVGYVINSYTDHGYGGYSDFTLFDAEGNIIEKLEDYEVKQKPSVGGLIGIGDRCILNYDYSYEKDETDEGYGFHVYDSSGRELFDKGYCFIYQFSENLFLAVPYEVDKNGHSHHWHSKELYLLNTALTDENAVEIVLDGNKISSDASPRIIDDRTFVPMRVIFEAFGMTVDWNGDTRTVTANNEGNSVEMTIGSDTFYYNGKAVLLDAPARIVNDRTLVPVRAVSESLGCEVDWDGEDRRVKIISSPDKITGRAVVSDTRCYIDYQPIECVNINGFTYLKATELSKYGFDVIGKGGSLYLKRNKSKLPVLINEYKDKLIKDEYKGTEYQISPHSIIHILKPPSAGKEYNIFSSDETVYLDGEAVNGCNVDGDIYIQADELQRYGEVEWVENDYDSDRRKIIFGRHLQITMAYNDRDTGNGISSEKLKHYTGYMDCLMSDPHQRTAGMYRYSYGKRSGWGYYINFFDYHSGTLYYGGEYADDSLKNGVVISADENDRIVIYEVKNFERIQLYPRE